MRDACIVETLYFQICNLHPSVPARRDSSATILATNYQVFYEAECKLSGNICYPFVMVFK